MAEENKDNYELVYAFYYMSNLEGVNDSKSYEETKELFRKLQSEHLTGRKLTEEHKLHIRESCAKYKGENNPACRPEVREKISKALKAKSDTHWTKTPEARQ